MVLPYELLETELPPVEAEEEERLTDDILEEPDVPEETLLVALDALRTAGEEDALRTAGEEAVLTPDTVFVAGAVETRGLPAPGVPRLTVAPAPWPLTA